jgi:hypothetical protein
MLSARDSVCMFLCRLDIGSPQFYRVRSVCTVIKVKAAFQAPSCELSYTIGSPLFLLYVVCIFLVVELK